MVNTKEGHSECFSRQIINIIDELDRAKYSMEGTECVLLAMCEAFRLSSRDKDEFSGAVQAVHDLLGIHLKQLHKVKKKLEEVHNRL